jgi:5-methylthioadenosine/S-adenosylhomocysteine deaminase
MILKDVIIYENNCLFLADIEIQKQTIENIVTRPYKYSKEDNKKFFVTPGFVNAHLHPNKLLSRGVLDDLNIEHLLSKMHISAKSDYNIKYKQALFTLADAIMHGSTTIYAVASNPSPVIEAFKYIGLKGAISCFFNDCWDGYGHKPLLTEFSLIKKKFNEVFKNHNEQVGIHIGTASTQSASNKLLILFDQIAEEFNAKVNIHISEGEKNVQNCLKYRNHTPIELLNELGVLNHRWNLIHATTMNKNEIKMIANNGANIILCPVSNAKIGVGIAPIRDFIEQKINLSLGTDACSNNNTNNILSEAYFAQLIFNATQQDGSFITYRQLYKWLTISGRSIFQMNDIGEIAIGQRADLLLWSLDNPSFSPLGQSNYLSKIFYNAPDIKPHTVILGGIKAVENYKFLLFDQHELLAELNNYSANYHI